MALTSARSEYRPDTASTSGHCRRDEDGVDRRAKLRMDPAEHPRQVALLGERVEIARPRQRLAHVVAGRRQHGAERQQRGARAAHEEQ